MPQMTREEYLTLTTEEKRALKEQRRAEAKSAVQSGAFPDGVRVKIGDFTLTCKPSGVSDKGSVAYNHPPMVINVRGRKIRINQISISVLNEPAETDADLENGEYL